MDQVFRDRDVRNAMRDLAEALNRFDVATTAGLPETQPVAGDVMTMVDIEPLDWNDESPFDDDGGPALFRTATVKVTILCIGEDAAARDETAELLWNLLANAWNGVSLAGLTMPDKTQFTYTRWLAVKGLERRVESKFIYTYQVGGFRDFGEQE
jgi:hypothetical protein